MKNIDKLDNHAAGPVESLSIAKLQIILDSINAKVEQTCDIMPKLLEQVRSETKAGTYDASFKDVLHSLSVLRSYITQIEYWIKKGAENKQDLINTKLKKHTEDEISQILVFAAESTRHLESAQNGLFILQAEGPANMQALDQIFQAFHSIKGMAWFLNLVQIGALAHCVECLFDNARKGSLTLTLENIDVIFESLEMLKDMISDLSVSEDLKQPASRHINMEQVLQRIKNIGSERNLISSMNL